MVKLTSSFRKIPLVLSTSHSFPHSCLITWFAIRVTRRLSLLEEELLTLPEHLISTPALVGFILFELLLSVYCFVNRCLSFYSFYSFWPLCCLSFDLWILITPFISLYYNLRQLIYSSRTNLSRFHWTRKCILYLALLQFNLIKITSRTFSPLLVCHVVCDLKKHHNRSHESNPMS